MRNELRNCTISSLSFDAADHPSTGQKTSSSLFTGSGTVFSATKSHRSCVFIVDLNAPEWFWCDIVAKAKSELHCYSLASGWGDMYVKNGSVEPARPCCFLVWRGAFSGLKPKREVSIGLATNIADSGATFGTRWGKRGPKMVSLQRLAPSFRETRSKNPSVEPVWLCCFPVWWPSETRSKNGSIEPAWACCFPVRWPSVWRSA